MCEKKTMVQVIWCFFQYKLKKTKQIIFNRICILLFSIRTNSDLPSSFCEQMKCVRMFKKKIQKQYFEILVKLYLITLFFTFY